ncbi:MAG: CHAT domain-containing protein [Microcoleaceae cyanobacterium MO_207.B10]|nr:CHAT domain-containing protein [Microcoleaceae cyanobacterium MO_207.B10]
MKTHSLNIYHLLALILGTITTSPAQAQPITPANDGTNTTVIPQGNQFNIQGGTRNGANLFHSFDQFNVNSGQTANFISTPDTRNILSRITGGNASIINGLIQVIGGNSNLFLMNPAGIMFGKNSRLNVPASFSVTTATGIGFNNNNYWFQAMGTNNYTNLVGNPSGYKFNVSNPGAIVNQGNLSLTPGNNLTLLGGTVINTGELSTPGGNITIAAVEGGSTLRISQPGHLLSLEVGKFHATSLQNGEEISNFTPLLLPELLTGGEIKHASNVIVNTNGDVVLTDSNTIVDNTPGTAITSGNISVSTPLNPGSTKSEATSGIPLSKGDGRGIIPGDGRGSGGQINILGDRVAVIDANINANGLNGGGQILIGGDFQGDGIVPNSQQTFVNNNSIISADAIRNGDGGRVIIWSDGITDFGGNISAKGGNILGYGGFVEVSGKQQLIFDGSVNVTAAFGRPGTILLDPENITVGESETTETIDSLTAENIEDSETEIPTDPFTENKNSDVTISVEDIGELSGDIILQADNDITINEKIETRESLELKAGRSININADIDTSIGNGNIDLFGNNNQMNSANRSSGAASINQQEGTTLNAGSGKINIQLGNLGEIGNINLANLTTTEELLVNANGGNITRVSENSIINAGRIFLQTNGSGGIGLTDAPLRLNVENLEAVSGSGGMFFDVLGDVNIGGVSDEASGIATLGGGDVELSASGDITVRGGISTGISEGNDNAGDISIESREGAIDTTGAIVNASSFDGDGGNVELKAAGDISTRGINASSGVLEFVFNEELGTSEKVTTGGSGNGGRISIESTSGSINTTTGSLLARSVSGNGGAIFLEAGGDIATASLNSSSDSTQGNSGDGGDISLEAEGNIATEFIDSSSDSEVANSGNGGAISLEAGGNINTESLNSSSDSTQGNSVNGGAISLEAGGNINTAVVYSSSNSSQGNSGNGGDISLSAEGDIATEFINSNSVSEAGNSGNGGDISLTSTGDISTTSLYSNSNSSQRDSGNGGAISLEAGGDISTEFINSNSVSEAGNSGNGGAISLSSEGNITTTLLYSNSVSEAGKSGGGGDISLGAGGNITTTFIDSASESSQGKSGNGGAISLTSVSDITTASLDSGSNSEAGNSGNGGAISLSSEGNITTAYLNSFSNSEAGNSGDGGAISLTSVSDITTEFINSNSNSEAGNSGNGGAISLEAGSNITTASLNSNSNSNSEAGNSGNGGAISLEAAGNITTEWLNSNSLSEAGNSGNGGDISLSSEGNITTESLYSNSLSEGGNSGNGGAISLNSEGNITTEWLYSSSNSLSAAGNSGNGGSLSLGAGGDITTESLYSNTLSVTGNSGDGGTISLSADTIQVKPSEFGNELQRSIRTFSVGNNNSGNSGDVNITANNLSNAEIFTRSSHERSGEVTIESQPEGNLQISDLFIITSKQVSVENSFGEVIQIDLGSTQGQSGNVSIISPGNINLNNVTIESDTKGEQPAGDINIQGQTLNLNQGSRVTTETSGDGSPGQITINANTIDIGENAQISSTVTAESTNTEGKGNINLFANTINISGVLGIFTQTEAESGNLTLNPYRREGDGEMGKIDPDLNINLTDSGFVSILTTASEDGGNINIFAPENINISGPGRITVESIGSGNAGIINIETENLTIAGNITISATTFDGTAGGSININPSQTFQLEGQIITETKGTGDGGRITINTGEMTAPNSTISAQSTAAGNAGEIEINVLDNITTGIITSEANNKTEAADAGKITITSQQGKINATQAIQSFSDGGNAGDITLQAHTDISTNTISSHGQQQGGEINIFTETGNVDTSRGFIANYSGGGEGGNITIETPQGNITTSDIYSFADADGGQIFLKATGDINITQNSNIISASEVGRNSNSANPGKGGDIILETDNNLNTGTAKVFSGASDGDSGEIYMISEKSMEVGDIEIDLASGFLRERLEFNNNNNFTFIPRPQGEADRGVAGNITLTSRNGSINSSSGRISSRSPDGSGDITLEARGNITTGEVQASALNRERPTFGGNIEIISREGEINATEPMETFSERGEAGSVALSAAGHIYTGSIRSEGAQRGGDVQIESLSENSIEIIGHINTYSTEGIAGDVTIRSPGNITLSDIRSEGMQQGGRIKIQSESGSIDVTDGDIDSFSAQGKGGNILVEGQESVNLANVSSFGRTESGDLRIQSRTGQVNTENITTEAPGGNSGNIAINAEEVGTGNLSSIGTTSAGEINVEATDGSIDTYDVEIRSDGTIGALRLRATEDITTGDINQEAGEGDANIEIESGGDQTTGNINQTAGNDAINNQTAGGNLTTGDINQTAGNDAINNQTAGGNLTTGDINQTAGNDAINNQTVGGNLTTGDINQTAGNDAINNQTAGGNLTTGDINQTAGNDAINNQTVGGQQNLGNVTQNFGNNTTNNQTAGGQQNLGNVTQNFGNNTTNNQTVGGQQNLGNVTQNFGNNTTNNQTVGGQQNLGNVTQNPGNNTANIQTAGGQQNLGQINQTFANESINIQNPGINQNPENISVINNNNPQNNQENFNNFNNNNNIDILNNPTNNTSTNFQETNNLGIIPPSDYLSISTPGNNNQTRNTATAEEKTEESINNTTDTQQILKTIDVVNTNSLTIATGSEEIVKMLEQNRIKEYSDYFGEGFEEKSVNTKNARDILTNIANQTGKESAVVYINAYQDQLQIILFTKDGQPILKTIPTVNRDKLRYTTMKLIVEIVDPKNRLFRDYLIPSQQLYKWLIAPISAELEAANIDTILFSMDAGFRLLPLAVLHDGEQFLIEKYSISSIPSISLMDSRYRSVQNTRLLGMGASEFTNQNPLPAVPVELETISQDLWQGDSFLNEEFTLKNLINQRKNYPYPIIHLATHAEFRSGDASKSYIQLWDEKLRLNQLRQLGWNNPAVELLVLSACETAVGNREAELGFAGFAVATGVKSVLASLWLVSDEGTLGLMTEFYSHLGNVKIKAEALREAQLAMLRGKVVIAKGILRGIGGRGEVSLPPELANIERADFSHPYYWAGFTMVGSPW